MTQKNPTKRRYNSSRRQAQALETQAQIVEVARKLFVERGYPGTSLEAIAQETGVATETIYAVFGNKKSILSRVVDVSGLGDGEPVPLSVRLQIQEIELEKNQKRQIQLFANRIETIMERVAPMYEVVRGAAKTEPDINNLLSKYLNGRMQGMGYFYDCLTANGPLRDGFSRQTAVEMLWTLTSAEIYNLLTVDRGLTDVEYKAWLGETLTRLLLP